MLDPEHGKRTTKFVRVMLRGSDVTEDDLRNSDLKVAAQEAVR